MKKIKLKELVMESKKTLIKEDHESQFRTTLSELDLAANEMLEAIKDEYGSGQYEMSERVEDLQEALDALQEIITDIQEESRHI